MEEEPLSAPILNPEIREIINPSSSSDEE